MSQRQIDLFQRIEAGLKDESIVMRLKGLVRPTSVEGLIRYRQTLEAALSGKQSD